MMRRRTTTQQHGRDGQQTETQARTCSRSRLFRRCSSLHLLSQQVLRLPLILLPLTERSLQVDTSSCFCCCARLAPGWNDAAQGDIEGLRHPGLRACQVRQRQHQQQQQQQHGGSGCSKQAEARRDGMIRLVGTSEICNFVVD